MPCTTAFFACSASKTTRAALTRGAGRWTAAADARSVDVEPAECEDGRGEGAQAGPGQDRVVAGADAAADLAVPDRPVEQGRIPSRPDPGGHRRQRADQVG